MTREEILRSMEYALESDKRTIKNPISEYGWLFDKIYKWKKSLEQEPCEDAIRRADAEALFRNARSKLNPSDYKTADEFNARDLMLLNAEQFIHLLPSVAPQQKVGKWIAVENEEMETIGYYCSECDLPMETEYRTKFCPNCGQRKTEVSENE